LAIPDSLNLDITKHLWNGSNVQSVNASLGLNSSPSTISLTLYDKTEDSEIYSKPSVGTTSGIKYNGLEFYGILTDWQKSTSISGLSYNINLTDIRELMSKIVLVLDPNGNMEMNEQLRTALSDQLSKTYTGDDLTNEINTQMETFEDVFPGIDSVDYPLQLVYVGSHSWSKILTKINATTFYVNQIGFKLYFDPVDWPTDLVDYNFTVNSKSVTINDLLDDLSRRCGFEWYTDSSANFANGETVSVYNIDRRVEQTEMTGAASSDGLVISPPTGITNKVKSFDEGESFVNDGTGAVLYGGLRRSIVALLLEGHLYDVIVPSGTGKIYPNTNAGVQEIINDEKIKRMLSDYTHDSAKAFLNKFSVNLSHLTSEDEDTIFENLSGYYIPSMSELLASMSSEITWKQYVIKNSPSFQAAFPVTYSLYTNIGIVDLKHADAIGVTNLTVRPVPKSYKECTLMNKDDKEASPDYYYIHVYDKDENTTTLHKAKTNPIVGGVENYTDFDLPDDATTVGSTTGFYSGSDIASAGTRFVLTPNEMAILEDREMPIMAAIHVSTAGLAEQYANRAFAINTNEAEVMGIGFDKFLSSGYSDVLMTSKPSTVDLRPEIQNKKILKNSGWWRKTTPSGSYTLEENIPGWVTQLPEEENNTYHADLKNAICQYFEDGSGMISPMTMYNNVDLAAIADVQCDIMYVDDINSQRTIVYRTYSHKDLPTPTGDDADFYNWEIEYMFSSQVSSNDKQEGRRVVYWFAEKKLESAFTDNKKKKIVAGLDSLTVYEYDSMNSDAGWHKFNSFNKNLADYYKGSYDEKVAALNRLLNKIELKKLTSTAPTFNAQENQITFYADIYGKCSIASPFYVLITENTLEMASDGGAIKYAELLENAVDLRAEDLALKDTAGVTSKTKRGELTDDEFKRVVQGIISGENKSIIPDRVYIPVEQPTRYGPKITDGIGTQPNGLVEYIVDEGYIPENYGGENVLDLKMDYVVNSLAFQNKLQYNYTIAVEGLPEKNLGTKMAASAVNSNITGITLVRGTGGFETVYNIESRKRKYKSTSDSTTEKRNVISGLLTESERIELQIKNLNGYKRAKQIITETNKKNKMARELKRLNGLISSALFNNGLTAKRIDIGL